LIVDIWHVVAVNTSVVDKLDVVAKCFLAFLLDFFIAFFGFSDFFLCLYEFIDVVSFG